VENYDVILYIYYDAKENIFYDDGVEFFNIFDAVTPNDIFLFRHDPGYCTFPHRSEPRILCEIITEE